MKKIFILIASLFVLASRVYATDVSVAAMTVANFNPSSIGGDRTYSVTTAASTTITCSACFPSAIVGIGGFQVSVGGGQYTVATIANTSTMTLTTAYVGVTGTQTLTLYKYVLLRIYADRPFQPAGKFYIVQPGVPGSQAWYKQRAASIVSTGDTPVLWIPGLTLDATTDATGPTNQAKYTWGFYRPDGSLIQLYGCFEQMAVPPTTPTTHVALCAYNSPPAIVPPANEAYTKTQIDARFPACATDQLYYFASSGNVVSCLTLGTNLSITGGTLNASGGGGGGTVNAGTISQLGYYAANGTTISGLTLSSNFTIASTTLKMQNVRFALNAKLDYGALGDGITDDTTAIQNCLTASSAPGGYYCYLPAATYKTTGLTIGNNMRLVGDGKGLTIISNVTNANILTVSTTASEAKVEDLTIRGAVGAGSANVGLALVGNAPYAGVVIRSVRIEDTGGVGLYVDEPFSSTFDDIYITNTEGYPLWYSAATVGHSAYPGNTFHNIYVGTVRATYPTAYRIYDGEFVCTACNGINSGTAKWAVVGQSTADPEGSASNIGATLDCNHCKLESFVGYGIYAYAGSLINLRGTTAFQGSGVNQQAITFDGTGDGVDFYSQQARRGIIEDSVRFASAAASYRSSQPIHTVGGGFPPIQTIGDGPTYGGSTNRLSTYRDQSISANRPLARADAKTPITSITTSTNLTQPGVRYIEASCALACTINLPWPGWYQSPEPVVIKVVGGTATNVTIGALSGGTVNGSTFTFSTSGQAIYLIPSSSSTDWRIISNSLPSSGLSGSGTANYLAYWSAAQTLAGNAAFQIDTGTATLSATNISGATVAGTTSATLGTASTTTGILTFLNSTNANTFKFQAGVTGANLTYTLPTAYSSGTQCLADNGAGVLSWTACSGGGGTPGGSNTQVQFNDSGSFNGDSGLTYNKTTNVLSADHAVITQSDTTIVPLIVQSVGASTAELLNIKDSGGSVRGGYSTAGAFFFRGFGSAPSVALANDGKLFYDITGGVTTQQLLLSKNTGQYNPIVVANQASYTANKIPLWSSTSWELENSMMTQGSGAVSLTIAPTASSSGSPTILTLTGPIHTTLAADTEATDVNLNLNRNVQFTAGGGTFSLQRAIRFQSPTYRATGAETISNATLLYLDTPKAGTNMTLTASYALGIAPSAAGHHGLYFDFQTSATGNFIEFNSSGSSFGKIVSRTDRANYVFGGHTTSTADTDGFVYIPNVAGVPAGTPTAYTGTVPLTVDSTNSRLYAYFGGAWINLTGSGAGTPGGSNTQMQYNNAGSFGGVTGATSNGTNITFGSGNLIATTPTITTSLVTGSASFDLLNTTATTINFGGAATALNMAGGSGAVIKIGGGANAAQFRFLEGSGGGTDSVGFKAPATIAADITWTLPGTDSSGTQCLASNGSGTLSWTACSGGSGSPGGADTQIQFNDAAAFGGDADFTWNKTTNTLTLGASATILQVGGGATAGQIKFMEPSGSGTNYTTFKAQAQAGNVDYTLPAADGTSGYVLSTNGSGVLSWVTQSSGTPAGLTGTLQYNNSGSFGAVTNSAVSGANITLGGNLTFQTANAIRTDTTSTNTLLFQAYDVDGVAYTTFLTLTAANTPTLTVNAALTWADGVRQTFNPNGTDSGLNVGANAGNPSNPTNGDIYFDNTGPAVFKCYEGAWVDCITKPSGTAGLVQYTSGTAFTSDAGLSYDGTTDTLTLGVASTTAGKLLFTNATNANTLTVQAGVTSSSYTITLPTTAGTNGYFLQTNGSGVTTWAAATATPAGSNKQVQFNNSSSFGGATGFEYQSGASPNVSITAQNAAYTALYLNSAATPSVGVLQVAVNSALKSEFGTDGFLYVGKGQSAALPTSGTVSGTETLTGTLNVAGGYLRLQGGTGTGTGVGGSIIAYTAAAGGSGTTQNSYEIAWETDSSGNFILGGRAAAAELRFYEPSGSGTNYTAFKAQAQAGNVTYTLPAADGSSGQVLSTNGSGTLSWATSGGGLTIGTTAITSGTAGRILYETSGNVVGETAGFTYQPAASPNLTITAQAASYVGLRINSAASPSVNIFETTVNGGASTGVWVTSTGRLRTVAGSVSDPAISFNDGNYGLYSIAAGYMGFSGTANPSIFFLAATASEIGLSVGSKIRFSNAAGNAYTTAQTAISQIGASGVGLELNNGTTGQYVPLYLGQRDAGTTTVLNALLLHRQSSGTPAAGLGVGLLYKISSSTTADQDAANITALWTTATHASRTSAITLSTVDNAASLAERWRLSTNGAGTGVSTTTTNFFGGTNVTGMLSESITLNTGGTTTDSTIDLPANSIILSVTGRITTTITTATDWKLGDATISDRFSDANATLTSGTTTVGINQWKADRTTAGQGAFQQSTAKVRITTTGTPGAGVIRITIHYITLTPSTS